MTDSKKPWSFKCYFCGSRSRRKKPFRTYCTVRKRDDKARPHRDKDFYNCICQKCERFFKKGDKELIRMWGQTIKKVKAKALKKKGLEQKLKKAIKTEQYEEAARLHKLLEDHKWRT